VNHLKMKSNSKVSGDMFAKSNSVAVDYEDNLTKLGSVELVRVTVNSLYSFLILIVRG